MTFWGEIVEHMGPGNWRNHASIVPGDSLVLAMIQNPFYSCEHRIEPAANTGAGPGNRKRKISPYFCGS